MVKILIVEDELAIADLIDMNLSAAGYQCDHAYDGIDAADKIDTNQYDLVLLDIMLPKADGFELMDYIRPTGVPVIFLTARTDLNDKVRGLRAGADDYIGKPFEVAELLARVETVLRRYHKLQTVIYAGDIQIDTRSRIVSKDGKIIGLTKKEYDLLLFFLQNKNIALFRETIYEKVWESNYMGDSRTVDLHVQRLRKKLGWEERLTAVYKIGYRLELQQ